MPKTGSYLQSNDGPVNFRDFKHASRLYVDGAYRLMPKARWLYYVTFEVQSNVIKDLVFGGRRKQNEIGALVKQVDLPKFQMNTEIMNQYNRKTVIQKNITYEPVSFVFHDDNANYVNDMWINYYRFYFNDDPKASPTLTSALKGLASNAVNKLVGGTVGGLVSKYLKLSNDGESGPYENTKYTLTNDKFEPTAYGLNVRRKSSKMKPFFRSITIYQLNRHEFVSYKLVNPLIKTWDHDRLDQTQGNTLSESKMSVDYEAVLYGKGTVSRDNPAGFAVFNYDNQPSPLGIGAHGLKSVFRDALRGAVDVFGDVLGQTDSGGSKILDALGAVRAVGVGNLVGIVSGNFSSQTKSNTGYSTLNYNGSQQNSLNGLGQNLNLNLGNRPETSGENVASPVVLTSSYVSQETPGGPSLGDGVFSRSPLSNGLPPATSNPIDASAAMTDSLTTLNNKVLESQISQPSEDQTPKGSTVAPGKYFSVPTPLDNTNQYTASNISQNSSISEIKQAISKLNNSWASDNDFVSKQVIGLDTINNKLSKASSSEEFNAIKNEASSNIQAIKSLQTTVDLKYKSEYERLTALLSAKETNVLGSANIS